MDKKKLREIFNRSSALPPEDDVEDVVEEREVITAGLLFLLKEVLSMDDDAFVGAFDSVKKIVQKLAREYYIKLWAHDDWKQEAQIILYQLLERFPELMHDEEKLRSYFKTKFRSYVLDNIRKQESQKRAFDKMIYEEISELGHRIPDHKMDTVDYIALKDKLKELKTKLSTEDYRKLLLLMRGGAFKGRSAFIKDIKIEFDDFDDDQN
ncbi:sigma-70 family RNA polymerase sigma factor [Streptococcus dentasini]